MPTLFQTSQSGQSTPPLVRFLVKNAAIGFAVAVVFVGAMLTFNIGNMAALFLQSGVGLFAVALMTIMVGLTFASLQMGFAVMFASYDLDDKQTDNSDPHP